LAGSFTRTQQNFGLDLSPERCGNFFRGYLRSSYDNELQRIKGTFVYVELLLAHAGAGKDRRKIVKRYFALLTEKIIDTQDQASSADIIYDSIERLKKIYPETEVLKTALTDAGRLLNNLILLLRSRTNPLELGLWDWDRLVSFWKIETGDDLELVLPEAQVFFPKIVNSLPDIVTREEIHHFINKGVYSISGPGLENESYPDVTDIPLSTAIISLGSDKRTVLISDESGYTAETITIFKEDQWYLRKGYQIYRSAAPFHVCVAENRIEKAAPCYRPNETVASNYFWSGIQGENLPFIAENGEVASYRIRFYPHVKWSYVNCEIHFSIRSFYLSKGSEQLEVRVELNSTEVWGGVTTCDEIRLNRAYEGNLLTIYDALVFRLRYEGGETAVRSIRFPFRNRPFVLNSANNGRIHDVDWLNDKASLDTFFLVARREDEIQVINGFHAPEPANNEASYAGTSHTIYKILPNDGLLSELCILVNNKVWFCGRRLHPRFSVAEAFIPSTENPVKIEFSENTVPLLADIELRFPYFLRDNSDYLSSWKLHVGFHGSFTETEIMDLGGSGIVRISDKGKALVSFNELTNIFRKEYQILNLQIRDYFGNILESILAFPILPNIYIKPCAVGEYSEICSSDDRMENHYTISSVIQTSLPEKFARKTIRGDYGAYARISWTPLIRDVQLLENDTPVDNYAEIKVCHDNFEKLEILVEGVEDDVTVTCCDKSLRKRFSERTLLIQVLNDLELAEIPEASSLLITSGSIEREWSLDFVNMAMEINTRWELDNKTCLKVEFSCFSLMKTSIEMTLKHRDFMIGRSYANCNEYDHATGIYYGFLESVLPDIYEGEKIEINLFAGAERLGTRTLFAPVTGSQIDSEADGENERIKDQVRELLNSDLQVIENSLFEYELLALVTTYIFRTGSLPFPLEKIQSRLAMLAMDTKQSLNLAMEGLDLLTRTVAGETVRKESGALTGRTDPAGLMLNTLKLINEIKRLKGGIGSIEYLNTIETYCVSSLELADETLYREWLEFLILVIGNIYKYLEDDTATHKKIAMSATLSQIPVLKHQELKLFLDNQSDNNNDEQN
jgi:hypothetical protein